MKNDAWRKILHRIIPGAIALAALVAPAGAQVPVVGDHTTPLLIDNFSSPTLTVDMNANYNDPNRQSGSSRYQKYIGYLYNDPNDPTQTDNKNLFKGDINTGVVHLGDPNLPAGTIAMTGHWAGGVPWPCAVLDKNWNNGFSSNGMTISFDMNDTGPYWSSFFIGGDPNTDAPIVPQSATNFFSVKLLNNDWVTYDCLGSTAITQVGAGSWAGGASINNSWHHFDVVCTDPTVAGYDGTTICGNPFDGSGDTKVDVYMDNNLVTSYTRAGGYNNNYFGFMTLTHDNYGETAVSLNDNKWCLFDNLSIYGARPNEWNLDANGNWDASVPANWSQGTVPNASGSVANFHNAISADRTVTVTSDVTVGTIDFSAVHNYTIAAASGKTITIDNLANSANGLIHVEIGNHVISAPLVQAYFVDLTVDDHESSLTITQPPIGDYGNSQWNIAGAGDVIVTYAFSPALFPMLSGAGVFEIGSGGSLDLSSGGLADMVPLGTGLGVAAGGTITADAISLKGTLWLDGGQLVPVSVSKTALNLGALGLANRAVDTASYTLESGETINVGGVLGGTGNSVFHFAGGTLVLNQAGGLIQGLTHAFVDANSTIDLNTFGFEINQALEGTGALNIVNTNFAFFYADSPSWSGGMNISGGAVLWAVGDNPHAYGTGLINVASGSNLWWAGGTASLTVANDITLNGPGNFPTDANGAAIGWFRNAGTGTFTGTLTVHNDLTTGAAPDIAANMGTMLEFNGKITDGGGANPVGGLQFGNAEAPAYGSAYQGSVYKISGSVSNDYRGDTQLQVGALILAKTGGAIAVPSANLTLGTVVPSSLPNRVQEVTWEGDNQLNPAIVVHMYGRDTYSSLNLMGHSQTIGGLKTDEGINVLCNSFFTSAPSDATGTLTVNSTSPDDYFHGIIRDYPAWAPSSPGKFALVKDGPGTLTLVAGATGWFSYTGTTTINAGTLRITSANTAEGASTYNILAGDIVGAGDLIVGDGVNKPVLTLTGLVNVSGTTTIEAGTTLQLDSASAATLDVVVGTGTLAVCNGTSLTATSIQVDTLRIGGAPLTPPAASTVPEPSSFVLLALAGMAVAWFAVRKR